MQEELERSAPPRLVILSDIRFLREGLAEVLAREGCFTIAGFAADIEEVLAAARPVAPRIMLIDATLRGGLEAAARTRRLVPEMDIVALGLNETEDDVIAWAEAGVCGYVPRSTALNDLVELLDRIVQGEQPCPSRIAASLLRRIAKGSAPGGGETGRTMPESVEVPALTRREAHVVRLLGAGLSNKEIARDLKIGVATIKTHMHSVLGKLALERRGQVARWLRDHEDSLQTPRLAGKLPAERSLPLPPDHVRI